MAILLFLAVTSGVLTPVPVQADPREQVTTAVSYGVRLLEEGAYGRFLQEFVSPKEFKQITGSEPGTPVSPRISKEFQDTKAPKILAALRDAQTMKPQYDADGLTAVYPLKTPIGGRNVIAFVKIGKYWYIKN